MTLEGIMGIGQEAIKTILLVAGPMLGLSLVVGLMVSAFQAMTQINGQFHGNAGPVVGHTARSYRNYLSFLGLLFGCIRQEYTTFSLLIEFNGLNDHTLTQRNEVHHRCLLDDLVLSGQISGLSCRSIKATN